MIMARSPTWSFLIGRPAGVSSGSHQVEAALAWTASCGAVGPHCHHGLWDVTLCELKMWQVNHKAHYFSAGSTKMFETSLLNNCWPLVSDGFLLQGAGKSGVAACRPPQYLYDVMYVGQELLHHCPSCARHIGGRLNHLIDSVLFFKQTFSKPAEDAVTKDPGSF